MLNVLIVQISVRHAFTVYVSVAGLTTVSDRPLDAARGNASGDKPYPNAKLTYFCENKRNFAKIFRICLRFWSGTSASRRVTVHKIMPEEIS